jgi:hypothetical protein
MKELLDKLIEKQTVETSRPSKSAGALKECIDRDYVHILFKKTDTELGIRLKRDECNFESADFTAGRGHVHIVGGLTLDYNKVKCIADIDISTCEGLANLEPVTDEEYIKLMAK